MSAIVFTNTLRPGAQSSLLGHSTSLPANANDKNEFQYPPNESQHMSYTYQKMSMPAERDENGNGEVKRVSFWKVFCTCRDVR